MDQFRERFRDETYFPKPLGRSWVVSTLTKFVKNDLPGLGGVATKATGVREWKKVVEKFETLIFQFVNETMSKGRDSALTNSMFAAMATGGQPAVGAQNLGAGYLFWTEDRTGDVADVALQARFDAMPAKEQNCAD